jgi:hypothetical protein
MTALANNISSYINIFFTLKNMMIFIFNNSNFPFTIKNKEVEIMEGWCLSGYDGRCQWSLS